MKAFKILRRTTHFTSSPKPNTTTIFRAFFSAEPLTPEPDSQPSDSTFDSSHYEIPISNDPPKPTWNDKHRKRVDNLFREELDSEAKLKFKKEEDERKIKALSKALLEAALNKEEEDDDEADVDVVKDEDQKSLSVGIIGAPNAGKSALTNKMVGTKVAAVSRKTNTTTHEVVGVLTKGDTQICFFDTPGLTLNYAGFPYRDVKARVESAWSSVNLYEVLIVIFDVHRHITSICLSNSKMVSEPTHDPLGHFIGPPAIRFLIGPSTIYIRATSPTVLSARGCVKEVPHRLRYGLDKCL
ncbi:hypothetical protein TSUD_12420 [Trifolium subterraneum]|uniref:G domain-containing protein n=1 Tax=Trifolium subterraneum TaxID=3900 RepID=A0A2Z6M5V6_TRISU|nr:hypothetical protein TSUD_12420 [Trifolium subterraneum]